MIFQEEQGKIRASITDCDGGLFRWEQVLRYTAKNGKGTSMQRKRIAATIGTVSIAAALLGVYAAVSYHPGPQMGVQTKTAGCQAQGPLPDPGCTPGAVFPNVTKEQICTPGYAGKVRNVSQGTKKRVYAEYGKEKGMPGEHEVDHLIPLTLGGSNEISNLWPEPGLPKPGFKEKDRVEGWLHDQVCDGNMSLEDAQRTIAANWLAILPLAKGQ